MHGPASLPCRARFGAVAMLLAALVFGACASDSGGPAREAADPARPGGRVAGEPDDRARSAVDPTAVPVPAVLHVLGSLNQLPERPVAIPTRIEALQSDLASIVTIGCVPDADGCESERLEQMAEANVEVVNLATGAVGSMDAEALVDLATDLSDTGLGLAGWGLTRAQAVQPLEFDSGGQVVALHAISLADDGLERTAHAAEETPGIAGPDAFADLLGSIAESAAAGHRIVVAVDWGDPGRRAPDEATVDIATALVRAGADAIVGSGSEFLNRLEVIDDVPVMFDLGQAATTSEDALRRDTAVLRVVFDPVDDDETCLLPATASPEGPSLDGATACDQ